jgi:hypothetical protein
MALVWDVARGEGEGSVEPRRPDMERTLPDGESTDPATQPAHVPIQRQKSLLASAVVVIALFGLGVALAHPFSSSPARSGAAVPTSTSLPPAPPFGLAQTPQPTPAATPPGSAATGTPDAGDGSDGSVPSDATPTPTDGAPQRTLPAYLLVHPKQQNPEQPCASGDWPPIVLTNAGGQPLDWSATTSTGAVSLDVSGGTLGANESLTVNLQGQLTNTTHPFVHVYFRWDGGLITATVYCTV